MVSTELDLEISEFNKSYWKKKNPKISFLEHFNVTQHSPNNCMLDKLILLQMNDFSIYWVVIVFIFFTHSSSSLYFAYDFFFQKTNSGWALYRCSIVHRILLMIFTSKLTVISYLDWFWPSLLCIWVLVVKYWDLLVMKICIFFPYTNCDWVNECVSECEWVCALGRT